MQENLPCEPHAVRYRVSCIMGMSNHNAGTSIRGQLSPQEDTVSALFSPITVKGVDFRNRVVMPPMVTLVADEQGCVTDEQIEHYARRARAGTGLIIVEATCVQKKGRIWERGLGAWSDDHIPGLTRLAKAIKEEGAVASIQLVHGGPQTSVELCGDRPGPSEVDPPRGGPRSRALRVAEMLAIQDSFAAAAVRCAAAGFEMVEIHGAHDFLLDSFLSAATNRRTDEYGGSFEKRMRMMVETCTRASRAIHDKALLCCRFSLFNKEPGEVSPYDLGALVGALEGAGVGLLHASTDGALKGCFGSAKTIGQWIKHTAQVPIVVAGGLGNPADAERAVAGGHTDFAAVGQAMMDDPEWTQHAKAALGG